jgi:FKBP-type peptidyl-prolyl cis-trans isomerase FklB
MKSFLAGCLVGCLVIACAGGQALAAEKMKLTSDKEKLGYSIGYVSGMNLKQDGVDVSADQLARGVRDGYSGKKGIMSDDEIKAVLTAYEEKLRAKQAEQLKKAGEANKKAGDAFLAENKKKPGVVTLPSGVQYKEIKAGTGKQPKASDSVKVHYTGTLIDGSEFDSSRNQQQPATFKVDGVIKGFSEALQMMKEGARWQVVIPAELAYGERGVGDMIGPNQTLIFDIELLEVLAQK